MFIEPRNYLRLPLLAAVIAHRAGYSVFTIGTAATVGLETLAEGGDNAALFAEAGANAMVLATGSGAARCDANVPTNRY